MPVYTFQCETCNKTEDIILPMESRNNRQIHACGRELKRLMSLPQPALFKQSGREMTLDSLNGDGKGNNGLSKNMKHKGLEKHIMQGFERNRPPVFKGVSV